MQDGVMSQHIGQHDI